MKYNKLIAEFMGYVYEDDRFFMEDSEGVRLYEYLPHELQYHSSWDWLMPVVLKCKESVDYCSDDNALKYHHIEDEMLSELSIENTYKAVVEFIKTYNNGI
tara:strand:+ start:31 stop:333 length:303 start_codon:yes stop_codon:yes gene_type:complete